MQHEHLHLASSERTHSDAAAPSLEAAWEPALPLGEPDPPAFPIDALPPLLGSYVKAESEALQVPADLPGALVLGAVAGAIAGRGRIGVKPGYSEPLNVFVAVALPPANLKSPAFANATAPLCDHEHEAVEAARETVSKAEARLDVLRGQLAMAKKAAAKNGNLAEVDELSARVARAEDSLPRFPRLVADDVTPEALAAMLAQQDGVLAVFSAEGGEVFEMLRGRYSQNTRANLGVFLRGHSGDQLRVDRVRREPIIVDRPALTCVLAVQPSVIQGLSDAPECRDRGLLARFLYAMPRSRLGHRNPRAPSMPESIAQEYRQRVRSLLRQPRSDRVLNLDPEARERWLDFATEIEPELAAGGSLEHLGDWGGKLAGQVARLAGILHAAEWADQPDPFAVEVESLAVERAVQLGRYFIAHARIAFGIMGADAEVSTAQRVLACIRERGLTDVSKRDLWQLLKGGLAKRAADLDAPLGVLVEHGYLRRKPSPEGRPGRRSEAYLMNPEALS